MVNLTFRRALGEEELIEQEEMLGSMDGLTLSSECDTIVWALEKNGTFFNSFSIYRDRDLVSWLYQLLYGGHSWLYQLLYGGHLGNSSTPKN